MKLPDDSIGISDTEGYRECPRRMSYQMRRHSGRAEQSDDLTPEVTRAVPENAYGSAIHEAMELIEDGHDVESALQIAWDHYGRTLDPDDLAGLRADIETFASRSFPGTRTVLAEEEIRFALFKHEGRTIYMRCKIDLLLEYIDRPGHYVHIDYKSSKWSKTDEEVQENTQLWTYNLAIHEQFPDVVQLDQIYEGLRHGQIPTRKSDEQREQIRDWLVREVTKIVGDEDWQDDGLLEPKWNRWCRWCPIMESCSVIERLTEFALVEIASAAPEEKVGRKREIQLAVDRIPEYVELLPKVKQAKGVLERFETSMADLLRHMPADRRAVHGYDLRPRSDTVFHTRSLRALHERSGDRFYDLISVTKSRLESRLVDDDELREWALDLGEKVAGTPSVVPRKDA